MTLLLESNGWDRKTRQPSRIPPSGSCDTAVHIYGRPGSSRLSPNRTYEPPEALLEDLENVHNTLGISRAVLIQPTIYDDDHSVLLSALAHDSSRYRGVALVDEQTSDDTLVSWNRSGVRGARFNFLSSLNIDWNPRKFKACVDRTTALGWVTLVHGTVDELLDRADMLLQVNGPVVVDHMAHWNIVDDPVGGLKHRRLCELLQTPNFWIKLSNGDRFSHVGVPFDDVVALGESFASLVPDRAIWATDWPHILYKGNVPNDADLLELLYRYAPDDKVLERILVSNPKKLFGF